MGLLVKAARLMILGISLTLLLCLAHATTRHALIGPSRDHSQQATNYSPASLVDASNITACIKPAHDILTEQSYGKKLYRSSTSPPPHQAADLRAFGQYVPYKITKDQTLVGRDAGLIKRAPAYRGIAIMDCLNSPQACQNACYYHNCINRGRDLVYTEPGARSASRNQVGVGTTSSAGTPCSAWPFGQRFWDRIGKATKGLDTDEWPMDQMQRDDFDPNAVSPQFSLRCMPHADNTIGATGVRKFREGWKEYAPGGRYNVFRTGNAKPIIPGDTYRVEFWFNEKEIDRPENMDFSLAGSRTIYNLITYCHPDPDCENDGFQFHLTNLRVNAYDSPGKLGDPYDKAVHNTYRLTDEPADIRQIYIALDIADDNTVSARMYEYVNGAQVVLAERNAQRMNNGYAFSIAASGSGLPLDLNIRKVTKCYFQFIYGNPQRDGIRHFAFTSKDDGYAKYARKNPSKKNARDGNYCLKSEVDDDTSRLECTFPAW